MEYLLPQEIQVRYILPAIRGELAKSLVKDCNLSQKEAAQRLGMTEAAISQYLSKRRGNNVVLNPMLIEKIKKSATQIAIQKAIATQELLKLSQYEEALDATCAIHLLNDSSITKECRLCFERVKK